jgi:cyclophilin family peptidyl-prolyl cis-trans isomerase
MHPTEEPLVVTPGSDHPQPSAKLRLITIGQIILLVTIFVALSRTHSESPAVNRLRMPFAVRRAVQQHKEVDFRSEQAEEEKELIQSMHLEMEIQAQIQTQIEQLVQARIASDFNHPIRGISEQAVLSKYGKGPYRVEVITGNSESFVLEIISVKEMPHTVHYFLEMVEHGLWDGTILVHGMGVQSVHAIPQTFGGEYAERKFNSVHLGSLLFEESGGYSHEKYTVSFSKQRGPDFYINLQDNTEHNEFASCFAKVVKGFDVLDRILDGGDNLDNNMRFFNIEQMRVASNKNPNF